MAAEDAADRLMAELLEIWSGPLLPDAPSARRPIFMDVPTAAPSTTPSLSSLGSELGEHLGSEILEGVQAGRQGIFISEPDRVRTAIFVRGLSLGEFARRAGLAPSTLSRALAGQPIAPGSWRLLITTLRGL